MKSLPRKRSLSQFSAFKKRFCGPRPRTITGNSTLRACRMNWVTRSSFRNLFRQIFLRRRWKYCERTSASSGLHSHNAGNAIGPACQGLETHSFARSSRSGTRKSAFLLLPHVLSDFFVSLGRKVMIFSLPIRASVWSSKLVFSTDRLFFLALEYSINVRTHPHALDKNDPLKVPPAYSLA